MGTCNASLSLRILLGWASGFFLNKAWTKIWRNLNQFIYPRNDILSYICVSIFDLQKKGNRFKYSSGIKQFLRTKSSRKPV